MPTPCEAHVAHHTKWQWTESSCFSEVSDTTLTCNVCAFVAAYLLWSGSAPRHYYLGSCPARYTGSCGPHTGRYDTWSVPLSTPTGYLLWLGQSRGQGSRVRVPDVLFIVTKETRAPVWVSLFSTVIISKRLDMAFCFEDKHRFGWISKYLGEVEYSMMLVCTIWLDFHLFFLAQPQLKDFDTIQFKIRNSCIILSEGFSEKQWKMKYSTSQCEVKI